MPDTHHAGLERPENTETIGFSTTPDFEAALIDAGRLLEHAANNGSLSEGGPDASQAQEALIRDLVFAQEAARSGQLTPQLVIAFWIAGGSSGG